MEGLSTFPSYYHISSLDLADRMQHSNAAINHQAKSG